MSPTTEPDNNTAIEIRNAWLCRVEADTVRPVFCHLTLAEGRIRAVEPADYQAFLGAASTGRGRRAAPADGAGHPDGARQPGGGRQPAKPVAAPPPARRAATAGSSSQRDVLDAAGRLVTAPLANFHEHFYSRLAKGLALPGPTDNFRNILKSFWWELDGVLDPDMIEACARLGVLESIRCGVTYIFDHHSSPASIPGSLATVGEVLSRAGLRGVLCYETSDRNGRQATRAALEENRRFLTEHGQGEIRGLMGLHAPFTVGEETLSRIASICRELDAGIHTHLAEDRHEQEHSRLRYGMPAAVRLQKQGLLERPGILAHAVHLEPPDRQAIAAGACALALNPDSNLNNAVGLAALGALPERVPVLAGTDGMHAAVTRSLKQLFLLYRHQGNGIPESFSWAARIFFDQVRFVRLFFPDYPGLQEGDRADLVIWDYRPPSPLDEDTFWGHYIFGLLESAAWSVLMKGRLLLRAGEFRTVDPDATARSAARQGARLFRKLGAT